MAQEGARMAEGHWPAGAARAEWRAHWTLPLVGMLGFGMGTIPIVTTSPFITPLEQAFHWTRTEITAGLTLYSIASVICQPFVGRMIDRWGPRPIGFAGVLLGGITFALFATATGSVGNWLFLWLLFSLGAQFALMPVWSAAVASEFEASRGLALAVTLSGSSIMHIVGPIVATLLIDSHGWRSAYLALGLGPMIVTLIPAWFFFYSRRDGQLRSGETARRSEPAGVSAREGMRSPVFYKLIAATLIGYTIVPAIGIHLMPILTSSGLSREQAAVVLATYGIFSIAGRLICGVLVNDVPGHVISAVLSVLPIGTAVMLMTPSDSVALRLLAISFFALIAGGQLKMLAYLTSRYFGLRAYGAIFGVVSTVIPISAGAGPLLAAMLYDSMHSYQALLIVTIPVTIVAGLIMLSIGGYPEALRESVMPEAAAGKISGG
jgi:MFS family permease